MRAERVHVSVRKSAHAIIYMARRGAYMHATLTFSTPHPIVGLFTHRSTCGVYVLDMSARIEVCILENKKRNYSNFPLRKLAFGFGPEHKINILVF